MTFSPPSTLEAALPENVSFAEEYEAFHEQWTNLYRKVASKINGKERALYPLELEILNDQQFFTVGNTRSYRSVFRKVFHFGAIAAGAVLNVPHGIDVISAFTRIYGTIITNFPDNRPLPYVDTFLVTNQASVLRNGLNIVIINGATAPAITSGLCVIEYVKQ